MEKKTKDMLISALISGGAMVAISNIPFLNYINYVCCLGILAGGFAGTLYYRTKQKITPKDGSLIGLFGGLAAGLLNAIISVFALLIGKDALAQATATLAKLGLAWVPMVTMIAYVILGFVIYAGFGTLGGLIGGAIFQKGK